jgi:hypothetical protein
MDNDRKILLKARTAHTKRTGHRRTMIGMNFLDCLVCNRHAHIVNGKLYLHGRDNKQTEIKPEEF